MVATSASRVENDARTPATEPPVVTEPTEQVMDLLEEHVPLSLLIDLVPPDGPDSRDILDTEGAPDQAWWE